MEALMDTPASGCHILTNSPALHSLKRRQLVQLCKRNGIKATGKNSEMVDKLKAHASALPLVNGQSFFSDDNDEDKENRTIGASKPSAAWSLIQETNREVERVHSGLNPPSPQLLNADDSQDQSMLDLGASTVRLVTTAPTAPSPPMLRPFTPSFEPSYSPGSSSAPTLYPSLTTDQDSDPLPPGGFPAFNTPSKPPKISPQILPPFVFGSPVHHISNAEFNSAAESVLAEMNARLGLTGTSNEVNLGLLQNRGATDAIPISDLQDRPRTAVTRMFDRAHERQFQKMEGLGEWYARRNAAAPGKSPQDLNANKKRKSDVLGDPHRRPIGPSNARAKRTSRVVTSGTRRSLVAAAEAEDRDGRRMKRIRISVVDGGDKKIEAVADKKSLDDSEDEETAKTNEERERERAAIKKKLEVSRARRRSSMGRVSVGGGKPPLIPNQTKKGMGSRFGFLSSAKNIVKSVWKGVGSKTPKQNPTFPVPGQSQRTVPTATKKFTPNVLMKPATAAKSSVPRPPFTKAATLMADFNRDLRIPVEVGLGRTASTGTITNSTVGTRSIAGTRSSATSSGARSTTPCSGFVIPTARRGPIPSFQQPLNRTTNSLASVGGTLGSRTRTSPNGTGSSQGSSIANSIGLKRSGIPSGVRSSDVGNSSTNSIVRKRTSTLLAPTASSLAKMQSTVRPSASRAALRPSAIDAEPKALPKVSEQTTTMRVGLPGFAFTSPPSVAGALTTNKESGSIFSKGVSPLQVPASETNVPKPRAVPARRPRISRSRVIARVGAQRAASGSSLTRTPSGRRSFNVPKTRGSLGVRVSGIGAKTSARGSAAMSVRKRLRQSEVLRRRSKLGGVTPPPVVERDSTPNGDDGDGTEEDESFGAPGASLDISMDG